MVIGKIAHETLHDALRDLISALGGAKRIGPLMRPEKTIDEATRWILDCLNPDRREKFDPEQILWLLREGRTNGCHLAMEYVNRFCLYEPPRPVNPEDRLALLLESFNNKTDELADLAKEIRSAKNAARCTK